MSPESGLSWDIGGSAVAWQAVWEMAAGSGKRILHTGRQRRASGRHLSRR